MRLSWKWHRIVREAGDHFFANLKPLWRVYAQKELRKPTEISYYDRRLLIAAIILCLLTYTFKFVLGQLNRVMQLVVVVSKPRVSFDIKGDKRPFAALCNKVSSAEFVAVRCNSETLTILGIL